MEHTIRTAKSDEIINITDTIKDDVRSSEIKAA